MIFNASAGHNPDGKIGCGAIGLIKESTEARNVKNEMNRLLKDAGHTVYDCTVDNGTSQSNILVNIVKKCNAHDVDLDVSVHFNSFKKDYDGDGKSKGVEVLVYDLGNKEVVEKAKKVCEQISKLGFTNRGVKERKDLYFLRKTKAPAMLIECCFVDDKDDVELYDYQSMARAIVEGLIGYVVIENENTTKEEEESVGKEGETPTGDSKAIYRVQVGAYSVKGNADALKKKLEDAGFDAFITKA